MSRLCSTTEGDERCAIDTFYNACYEITYVKVFVGFSLFSVCILVGKQQLVQCREVVANVEHRMELAHMGG